MSGDFQHCCCCCSCLGSSSKCCCCCCYFCFFSFLCRHKRMGKRKQPHPPEWNPNTFSLDFSYTNTNYICMSIHPGQCMNEQPYPAKSSTTRKALWRYFHSLLRQHDASVAPDDEVKSVDKGYMTRLSTVSRFIKKFDTRNLARTCWEDFWAIW